MGPSAVSATSPAARQPWVPALADRQVRLYLAGHATSTLGAWTLDVTLNLLLWQLTASPALLGLLNFLLYAPGLAVVLLTAGRLHPAAARRRTMAVLVGSLCVALLLVALLMLGLLGAVAILVLAGVRGVLNGIELPARQLMALCLVEDRELQANVVALNTVSFLGARMTGPALAAALFATLGPLSAFVLAALALVVMLACIRRVRPLASQTEVPAEEARGPAAGLAGAWRFVRAHRLGSLFLPVLCCTALLGSGFQTLAPVLADRVFGDVNRYTALLLSAAGAGALLAAMLLSTRWLGAASLLMLVAVPWGIAASALLVAASGAPMLALLGFAGLGFGTAFVGTASIALMHRVVPPETRAGLISLFLVVFIGVVPMSQILAGLLAQWLSARASFAVLGLTLAAALMLLFVPRWRALGRVEWNAERL